MFVVIMKYFCVYSVKVDASVDINVLFKVFFLYIQMCVCMYLCMNKTLKWDKWGGFQVTGQKLSSYWDFYAQPGLRFKKNDPKTENEQQFVWMKKALLRSKVRMVTMVCGMQWAPTYLRLST